MSRFRLLYMMTSPISLMFPSGFLRGKVDYLKEHGVEIHVASSPGKDLDAFQSMERVPVYAVEMPRRITPFHDLIALCRLVALMRRIRPTILHANTPKGGLLGTIAALLARVPVRIYHMHGLPYKTASGLKRRILFLTERISCAVAHRVFCVSESLREVALAEGICSSDKLVVLGGHGNGVDADVRFNPALVGNGDRCLGRESLGIPEDSIVLGFVGRVVKDKGIVELAEAWKILRSSFPGSHLLIVGPFEPQDPVPIEVERQLREDTRVHFTGQVANPAYYYATMDVVTLPSYREGFNSVLLEAAAMELPVVATRIPGCVDGVQDGVTGVLVLPHDAKALADALRAYFSDATLRSSHGIAGRIRVLREFREKAITEAMFEEYCRLLRDRGIPDSISEAVPIVSDSSYHGGLETISQPHHVRGPSAFSDSTPCTTIQDGGAIDGRAMPVGRDSFCSFVRSDKPNPAVGPPPWGR